MSVAGWKNYGPLTTAFVPPADCTVLTVSYPSFSPTSSLNLTSIQTPRLLIFNPIIAPSCFPTQYPTQSPPRITAAPTTLSSGLGPSSPAPTPTTGYFSPGRCPSGWETRTLNYSNVPPDNTLALCCPTGYNFQSGGGLSHTWCTSHLPKLYSATTSPPKTIIQDGTLTTMSPEQRYAIGSRKSARKVTATGIIVMWRKGDFPDMDALISTPSSNPYLTRPAGLQLGTKIAVGVIIPMVAILLGFFIFLICRRRRWNKENKRLGVVIRHLHLEHPQTPCSDDIQLENTRLMASESSPKSSRKHSSKPVRSELVLVEEMSPNGGADISSAPILGDSSWTSDESPPPYTPAGPSTIAGAGHGDGVETELEYQERRLKERKQLLAERIRLAREEDALRQRLREENAFKTRMGRG